MAGPFPSPPRDPSQCFTQRATGLMLSLCLLQTYWQQNCPKLAPRDGNTTGEGTQSDSWDLQLHKWATPLLALPLSPGVPFPGARLLGPEAPAGWWESAWAPTGRPRRLACAPAGQKEKCRGRLDSQCRRSPNVASQTALMNSPPSPPRERVSISFHFIFTSLFWIPKEHILSIENLGHAHIRLPLSIGWMKSVMKHGKKLPTVPLHTGYYS